jgi:hypothetical protein
MWERCAETEEARHEADARPDEQFRREREEQDRRQLLAELRASPPEDMLATLKRRAEAALTAQGVEHTRLGYDVLVKIKTEELLERDYLSAPARDDRHAPDPIGATAGTR